MPKDAKLDRIELKRDDFNTDLQMEVAEILLLEWPANFKDLEEKYKDDEEILAITGREQGPDRGTFGKVYNEYFGDPEDPQDRTVNELRTDYGRIKYYKQAKDRGEIEEEEGSDGSLIDQITDEYQKGYLDGWKDGYGEGFKEGSEFDPKAN